MRWIISVSLLRWNNNRRRSSVLHEMVWEIFVSHLICHSSKNWFFLFWELNALIVWLLREVNISISFCFQNQMWWNRFSHGEMIEWRVLFSAVIVVSDFRERHRITSRRQFFVRWLGSIIDHIANGIYHC
jgi:hypothetical protein